MRPADNKGQSKPIVPVFNHLKANEGSSHLLAPPKRATSFNSDDYRDLDLSDDKSDSRPGSTNAPIKKKLLIASNSVSNSSQGGSALGDFDDEDLMGCGDEAQMIKSRPV